MLDSRKRLQIIAMSTGVAVSWSATSIVLLQPPGTPNEGLKTVQSALRDGAAAKAGAEAPIPVSSLQICCDGGAFPPLETRVQPV